MLNASHPLANWLWKDLYVWPQGHMSPSTYLGALFRIIIVYVIFAQLLTVFGPALFQPVINSASPEVFQNMIWGQIAAIALIAFPVWSAFQRRLNDMRPNIREKLTAWSIAFPIIFIGLIGFMIANAAGFETPFDNDDLARLRSGFALMLFGAAFVPGGNAAPVKADTKSKPVPELFQTANHKSNREALAAQVATKPAGRHLPTAHVDRPKPTLATNFPPVIQRTRNLPQDGRVKPGWFS